MTTHYAKTSDSLRDHFLISTPALNEGFFTRSVTYICEHGESGAMGIVINHPLEVELPEIFEHLDLDTTLNPSDRVVLAGGPVQIDHGFVLHTGNEEWESSMRVARDVMLTTSRDILKAIAGGRGPDHYLVALGYAGWEAGQLEEELTDNAWLTIPADNDLLFNVPYEQRLAAAGRKLGIDIDLMSSDAGHA